MSQNVERRGADTVDRGKLFLSEMLDEQIGEHPHLAREMSARRPNDIDTTLVARRVASMRAKLVASPDYIRRCGAPETPDELAMHETLLQGTETWRLIDGSRVIAVRPPGSPLDTMEGTGELSARSKSHCC